MFERTGDNAKHGTQSSQLMNLQMSLLNAWTKARVEDFYQNNFLAYIDHLPPNSVETEIQKEIKLTLENKSLYFTIKYHLEMRDKLIVILKNLLEGKETLTEEELGEICMYMKKLREANLQTTEAVFKMPNYFETQTEDNSTMLFYEKLFSDLDSENGFLKDSRLKEYILFGPGYDPFLLHHYEQVCKDGSIKLKPSQAVDNLYDLSISYAYRLLKTKHAILNLRSGGAIRLDDVKDYENRKSIQKEQKYQISPSLSLSQYGEDETHKSIDVQTYKIIRQTQIPTRKQRPELPFVKRRKEQYKMDEEEEEEEMPRNISKNMFPTRLEPIRLDDMGSYTQSIDLAESPEKGKIKRNNKITEQEPQDGMIKFLNEARYKTQSDHSEDDMLSNLDERVSVSSGKIKHNVRGIFKDKREMPTNQSIMGKRRIEEILKVDSSNRRQSQEQPKRESYTRGYMSLNKEDKGKTLVRNLLPLKTEPISLPKNEFKADLGLVETPRSRQLIEENPKPIKEDNNASRYTYKSQNKYDYKGTNKLESLFPIDNEIKNPKEIGSIKLFKMEKRYKKNPVYVEEKEQDGLGDEQPLNKRKMGERKSHNNFKINRENKREEQLVELKGSMGKERKEKEDDEDKEKDNDKDKSKEAGVNSSAQKEISSTKKKERCIKDSECQTEEILKTSPMLKLETKELATVYPEPKVSDKDSFSFQRSKHLEDGHTEVPKQEIELPTFSNNPKVKPAEISREKNQPIVIKPSDVNRGKQAVRPEQHGADSNDKEEDDVEEPKNQSNQGKGPVTATQESKPNSQIPPKPLTEAKLPLNTLQVPQESSESPEVRQKQISFSKESSHPIKMEIEPVKEVIKQEERPPVIESTNKSDPNKHISLNSTQLIDPKIETNKKETLPQQVLEKRDSTPKKETRIMKIGKLSYSEILPYLRGLTFNPQYSKIFPFEKLRMYLEYNQTYLTEFHVDSNLAIVAFCISLPNDDVSIKYWGPVLPHCNESMSISFFKKYLEYIEKNCPSKCITYSGEAFNELGDEFVLKKENMYVRERRTPVKQIEREYKRCLYVECSNTRFKQSQNEDIFYSEEIEKFNNKNSYTQDYLSSLSSEKFPDKIKGVVIIDKCVKDFDEVNNLLTKELFDTYEISEELKISSIDVLRVLFVSAFRQPFVANEGHFKFYGFIGYASNENHIGSVSLCKGNGRLHFGKGFQSLKEFIVKIPSNLTTAKRGSFAVRMFSKKLYGRMSEFEGSEDGCYGNWEINLTWEDYLQGKIKHPMNDCLLFGSGEFWVAVEIEGIIFYAFQVHQEDFLS